MSYLVLARKWRPQQFDDLIGQEHVAQTLKNAIAADRVHHAFLFTGARGVGKTSAARIFAKALNCEQGPTSEPCGECGSCREITDSHGIDVQEIDGASNTGVDDIRELRENIRYLPSRARNKIFIIDEVHMLSINAFNALLKTLEEPPEHAKFIFATTEPHKIPITILSRCQRFDFKKIPRVAVQERLQQIVIAEGIEISPSGLAAIAENGGGSMRDALSTLDQVIAFCGNQVADDELLQLLGVVSQQLLLATLRCLIQRQTAEILELVRQIDEQGHSFRNFCRQLVALSRALVVLKVVAEPGDLVDFSDDEISEMRHLVDAVPLEELQRQLDILIRAEAELANSHFPRLTMEMVLIRLATLPSGVEVAALIERLQRLEAQFAGAAPVLPAASSAPPPVTPGADQQSSAPPPPEPEPEQAPVKKSAALSATADPDSSWAGLVEHIRQGRRPRISALLEQASLLQLALPQLRIGLPERYYNLADQGVKETLQELAANYFGTQVKVQVEIVAAGEAAPPSLHQEQLQKESDRQKKLRQNALEHPIVKSALDIFGGTIDNIKPIDKGFV